MHPQITAALINGEKRPFSWAEEFRINYVDIPPYRSIAPHSLIVHSDFLPKNMVWEEGERKELLYSVETWQVLPQPGDQGQHQQYRSCW